MEFLTLSLTFWLVLFTLTFLIGGLWASTSESIAISLVFLVVFILIGYIWLPGSFAYFMVTNPIQTLLYSIVYLGLGCLYVVYRDWPKYLDSKKSTIISGYNTYNNTVKEHLKAQEKFKAATTNVEKDTIRRDYRSSFYDMNDEVSTVTFEEYIASKEFNYNPSDHKNRISNAVLMWIFIILWDIIESPYIWLKKTAYRLIVKALETVTRNKLNSFNPDK